MYYVQLIAITIMGFKDEEHSVQFSEIITSQLTAHFLRTCITPKIKCLKSTNFTVVILQTDYLPDFLT